MKTLRQILNETKTQEKLSEKREQVSDNATSLNQISMEDLHRSFDVDKDGVVSESDYAAHIAWHLERPQLIEKAIGDLEDEHVAHIADNEAFCASEITENFGKEAQITEQKDFSRGSVLPPAMIIMKRVSVRQFSNGQKVALYYSKTINRYITVPYNEAGILDLTRMNNSLNK